MNRRTIQPFHLMNYTIRANLRRKLGPVPGKLVCHACDTIIETEGLLRLAQDPDADWKTLEQVYNSANNGLCNLPIYPDGAEPDQPCSECGEFATEFLVKSGFDLEPFMSYLEHLMDTLPRSKMTEDLLFQVECSR